MDEARRLQVRDAVELATLRGKLVVWEPATVVAVNDDYFVLRGADGTTPAYGYDDEGSAWRRRHVACPVCKGTGRTPAT